MYMPDRLGNDGRIELGPLKIEHRALEKEFARKLPMPSDGESLEDHA